MIQLKPAWITRCRNEAEVIAAVRQALVDADIRRHYRNDPDPRIGKWQGAFFTGSYARLQVVKQNLDPADRIRHPQSVRLPGCPAEEIRKTSQKL